jgi:p-aminobenzoyl-glutamate transporter AbgT
MADNPAPAPTRFERALGRIERVGNRLPDPAVLFLSLLGITMVVSALLIEWLRAPRYSHPDIALRVRREWLFEQSG